MIENLIIGTGPAAFAAAMALKENGQPFEVLDADGDLEPFRLEKIAKLRAMPPEDWAPEDVSTLFPSPKASSKGVEKRFAFGSDFVYRTPKSLSITTENCKVDISHGFGGFGNVWGAATLPFALSDLRDWPVEPQSLRRSYQNISRYVPVSGARDDLQELFPIESDSPGTLREGAQISRLHAFLESRKRSLNSRGLVFGRARVAVESRAAETQCRYCGRCLDGCVYGSIFNPREYWPRFFPEGVAIHRGFYAFQFHEDQDHVRVTALDLKASVRRDFMAKRVWIASGAVATTRLVARSLGILQRPISLKDSQYFFFPVLTLRRAPDEAIRFTLAELFLELLPSEVSPYFTHFQIYGLNTIFKEAIHGLFGAFPGGSYISKELGRRFLLFQGFLHSAHSGSLSMTLTAASESGDQVHLRGVTNPQSSFVAHAALRKLRQQLLPFGIVPPFSMTVVPIGRSFHMGSSFPMGKTDSAFYSDLQGRPMGLKRVHLMDASTFPSIPATTITYTIMANSDRIVNEACSAARVSAVG
jgi:hypothetical protein